jgi:hypothetical protein
LRSCLWSRKFASRKVQKILFVVAWTLLMCRLTFFKVSKPITQGYTSLGRCGFLVTTES